MTNPSLTYGQGFNTDCNDTTDWTVYSPTLATPSLTSLYDDLFDITGTASSASQSVNYYLDLTNISSDVYTTYILRYKTDVSATGLGANATLAFTTGIPQVILPTTFNTSWTIKTGTITPGRTIDKLYLGANSDSACGSGHHVYFDFALLCKNTFTFPTVSGAVKLRFENNYVDLDIPGRQGQVSQWMNGKNTEITLNGKIDVATSTWGTPYGQYLLELMQEASQDPFQWFTSDTINCKVTPRLLEINQGSADALREWEIQLKQYSRSGGQLATWAFPEWLGE